MLILPTIKWSDDLINGVYMKKKEEHKKEHHKKEMHHEKEHHHEKHHDGKMAMKAKIASHSKKK